MTAYGYGISERNLGFFLKALLFLILSIVLYKFNLNPEIQTYRQAGTTFSTHYEVSEMIQVPNILICMQPGVKKSVTRKYGYKLDETYSLYDTTESYKSFNLSLWEAYNDLGYKYGEDFEIHVKDVQWYVKSDIKIKSIEKVATILHGMCYLVVIDQQIKFSSYWGFQLAFNQSMEPSDVPKQIDIFVTSNDTWYGLTLNEWPYKQSLYLEDNLMDFDPTKRIDIGISQTEVKFLESNENVVPPSNCFAKLLMDLDCTPQCFPIIFNFVSSETDLPACKNSQEFWCVMLNVWGARKLEFIECLKPNGGFTIYETLFSNKKANEFIDNAMDIYFFVGSNMKQIKEEILVMDLAGFIGSIGGAFGLFFGFSFLGCCADVIDRLVTRLYRLLTKCIKFQEQG